jgi:folate-binding protein YgfZ
MVHGENFSGIEKNLSGNVKLYKLNKSVLRICNNPAQFLNGITANTTEEPQNVFLNIHGRIVAVFDQVKINDDEFWIVLQQSCLGTLFEHIDRYIKLSRVEVQKLEKHVYFDLKDNSAPIPETALVIPQKKGRLIVSDKELQESVSDEEFTLFRLRNNIPMQGIDFNDDFVLNVDEKRLVSFTKGCFLGQEPVSKVHNRSRPTWHLVVEYEDKCDEQLKQKMTSKAIDPETKRRLGFIFKRNESNK